MSDLVAFAIAAFIVGIAVALYHTRLVRKFHEEVTATKARVQAFTDFAAEETHDLRTRLTSAENKAAQRAATIEDKIEGPAGHFEIISALSREVSQLFKQTEALAESVKILGGLK